jgi:hypothetical protein
MRKYCLVITGCLIFYSTITRAQIGIGTLTPHPKAVLDISGTDKGLLIPRVSLTSTEDVTTITTPPAGLIVFNTAPAGSGATAVDQGLYFWDGEMWVEYVKYTLWKNLNTNGFYLSGDGTSNGLLLGGNGIVVGKGSFGTGPALGENDEGAKLIWYPKKAAFWAGYSSDLGMWNDAVIANYSTAFGYSTLAGGEASTAFGNMTIAGGDGSVAMGILSTANGTASFAAGGSSASGYASTALNGSDASGDYSFAAGSATYAGGDYSTALGYFTHATGDYATTLGYWTQANGLHALSMGYLTGASGENSLSTGQYTAASGNHTTAMGSYVSTNDNEGAFIIGDNSTTLPTNSTARNQMTMRFENGYRFFTNADATVGVKVNPGDNAWSVISDVHRKENFMPIDGEDFLSRIGTIPVTTWNYKGQDPRQHRHYGPMAQDIYKAFGRDPFGVIGTDTTINQADMNGINFTAIQALVKRTDELKQENQQLRQEMIALKEAFEKLKADK